MSLCIGGRRFVYEWVCVNIENFCDWNVCLIFLIVRKFVWNCVNVIGFIKYGKNRLFVYLFVKIWWDRWWII